MVSIKNSQAQILRDLFETNDANVEWCKGFGPEVLTKAPNDNILANFIFKSMIGEKTSGMMLQQLSDARPDTISHTAQ